MTIDEVDLSNVVYWIQIHGLPLKVFDEDNALLIGSKLGQVLEIDVVDPNKLYLRLRVQVNAKNLWSQASLITVGIKNLYGLASSMIDCFPFVFTMV